MARKKTTNGNGDPNSSSSVLAVDTKLAAKGTEVESEEDVITVNKMNLTELKNACDDAVKRVSLFRRYWLRLCYRSADCSSFNITFLAANHVLYKFTSVVPFATRAIHT